VLLTGALFCGDLQDALASIRKATSMRGKIRGGGRDFQRKTRASGNFGEFAFALQDQYHTGLIVDAGGGAAPGRWRGWWSCANNFKTARLGFSMPREWGDVEQEHVADAALENVGCTGVPRRQLRRDLVRWGLPKNLHGAAD
jgi:hypothetical protein